MGKNCVTERRGSWGNRAEKHSLGIKRYSDIYAHKIIPLTLQIMEKVLDSLLSNTLLLTSRLWSVKMCIIPLWCQLSKHETEFMLLRSPSSSEWSKLQIWSSNFAVATISMSVIVCNSDIGWQVNSRSKAVQHHALNSPILLFRNISVLHSSVCFYNWISVIKHGAHSLTGTFWNSTRTNVKSCTREGVSPGSDTGWELTSLLKTTWDRQWNSLPREIWPALSLEVFKTWPDEGLRN